MDSVRSVSSKWKKQKAKMTFHKLYRAIPKSVLILIG